HYLQAWHGAVLCHPPWPAACNVNGTRSANPLAPSQGQAPGGVISPLLANRYMNRFLRHWRHRERGKAFRAHVVNYADDFVILSRGYAAAALAWTRWVMTKLGLTV